VEIRIKAFPNNSKWWGKGLIFKAGSQVPLEEVESLSGIFVPSILISLILKQRMLKSALLLF
jgi:hypothetical protein